MARTPLSKAFLDGDDPLWQVVYQNGSALVPVEVRAPDEETAIMRAGMKRSSLLNQWGSQGFFFMRRAKWERVDVQRLG